MYIGNELFVVGQQLSFTQMAAVQLALQTGNTVDPAVLAQFNEQGGQSWISQNQPSDNIIASPASSAADVATSNTGATQNPAPAPQTATVLVIPESQVNVVRDLGPAQDDAPTRTLNQTQATPPININNSTPIPSQTGGVGSRSDDNTAPSRNATQQIINSRFSDKIITQPNILDNFASYSYAISWYLLTPDQYNNLMSSQKKSIAGFQLLMQSAGAPIQGAVGASSGRDPFFDLDFYIDNLEIDTRIIGRGTRAAHTASDIKFTVSEPNGLTFINKLYQAVDDLYKKNNISTKVNYPMAQYCLVVRFYGYDQNGNLVPPGNVGMNFTDPRAIVEKFYPMVITNIQFRVANKFVEYAVSAKPIPYFYNASQDRGTIPFNFELVGETVGQVLGGTTGAVSVSANDGRKTTPNPQTPKTVNPMPATGVYLSPQQMQANQDWYNKYGTTYNADGTLRG